MYEYTGSGNIQVKGSVVVEVQRFYSLSVCSTFNPIISDKHDYPERFWDWITRIKKYFSFTFHPTFPFFHLTSRRFLNARV
jgi:hypothetical protein